jgi:spermidine/putrescine-binding protein
MFKFLSIAAAAALSTLGVQAAYSSGGKNVIYYWGQVIARIIIK